MFYYLHLSIHFHVQLPITVDISSCHTFNFPSLVLTCISCRHSLFIILPSPSLPYLAQTLPFVHLACPALLSSALPFLPCLFSCPPLFFPPFPSPICRPLRIFETVYRVRWLSAILLWHLKIVWTRTFGRWRRIIGFSLGFLTVNWFRICTCYVCVSVLNIFSSCDRVKGCNNIFPTATFLIEPLPPTLPR